MPPPRVFLILLASEIKSLEPHTREPMGADNPFERQKLTESDPRVNSVTGTSSATAALNILAPSRWTFRPDFPASFITEAVYSDVQVSR